MICGKKTKKRKAIAAVNLNLKILSQKYRFSNKEFSLYTTEFQKLAEGAQGFTLKNFCKNMGPLGLEPTRLISDRIFLVMNKSKSGQVSLKEYLEYMDILMHGTQQEKLFQSYRLITQDVTVDISYSQFESWIVSVWKMYNILTGAEISATKENIRSYFDKFDTKSDGRIDFEEFQNSAVNNTGLGEWFDVINHRISENLKFHNEPIINPQKQSLDLIIQEIETSIQELKSFNQQSIISNSIESESEDIESQIDDCDSPEILLNIGKCTMPKGDIDDSMITIGEKSGISSVKMQTDGIGKIVQRLTKVVEMAKNMKKDENIWEMEKENAVENVKFQSQMSIRWGNSHWDLIMNMMIGIQKAVNSLASEISIEIAPHEFMDKHKHKLLPVKEKKVTFRFTDYAPLIFQRLRAQFGVSTTDYFHSLGVEKTIQCLMSNEFASLSGQCSSGKSGSFFFYSEDGKFMLKTITLKEYRFFRKKLADYYFHMSNYPHSLLTRFYGLHKITSTKPLYFVVMGNVFETNLEIDKKYDLKGSKYGRRTNPSADKSIARKDLDFTSKISLGHERKQQLLRQLEADSEMLQRLKIIDYSFLLGVHEVEKEVKENCVKGAFWKRDSGGMMSKNKKEVYFVGVIDFLTKFGVKKKMEHFIMGTLHGKSEVSCVPPEDYSRRFLSFLENIIE